MTQPVLTTDRLLLRPFRRSDAVPLHTFLSDPDATRYWGNPHTTLQETEAFVTGTMNASEEKCCDFVLEMGGAVVGKAGMWAKPEIGYFILPRFQGQGLLTEVLPVIIGYLFESGLTSHLTADTDPRNAPSIRALERCGFRRTGYGYRTICIDGKWCDSLFYRLERDAD